MKKACFIISVYFFAFNILFAQKEQIPVTNSVYHFFNRLETRGLLPHYSLNDIPLQKYEIINALEGIDTLNNNLSSSEKILIKKYLHEFKPSKYIQIVGDTSITSSGKHYFSNMEMYLYRYSSPLANVQIDILGSIEGMISNLENETNYFYLGQIGGRISGTLAIH